MIPAHRDHPIHVMTLAATSAAAESRAARAKFPELGRVSYRGYSERPSTQ